MNSIKNIAFFGLMGGALAIPKPSTSQSHTKINYPTNVGCGEVNVFYTYVSLQISGLEENPTDKHTVDSRPTTRWLSTKDTMLLRLIFHSATKLPTSSRPDSTSMVCLQPSSP